MAGLMTFLRGRSVWLGRVVRGRVWRSDGDGRDVSAEQHLTYESREGFEANCKSLSPVNTKGNLAPLRRRHRHPLEREADRRAGCVRPEATNEEMPQDGSVG